MLPLRALDPVLARDEVRVLHSRGDRRLPGGVYAFTEAFCTEPDCDQRPKRATKVRVSQLLDAAGIDPTAQ